MSTLFMTMSYLCEDDLTTVAEVKSKHCAFEQPRKDAILERRQKPKVFPEADREGF